VWDGLVVLDGSIVPTALGTNPALTIAALALRAVTFLCKKEQWNLEPTDVLCKKRPVRKTFKEAQPAPRGTNEFELVERVRGTALLASENGGQKLYEVELTLKFDSFGLESIIGPFKNGLTLKSGSQLKVFGTGDDREKIVTATLTGGLTAFRREASAANVRRCRAVRAWAVNRGVRDTWQWLWKKFSRIATPSAADLRAVRRRKKIHPVIRWVYALRDFGSVVKRKWDNAMALASHAGEARLLQYALTIGDVKDPKELKIAELKRNAQIRGVKRFTYSRRSNPWRQLQTIMLEEFPGFDASAGPASLTLDLSFFRQEKVPLMRVAKQQDQPAALADLFSLFAYTLRLMIQVHIWSFRRPEAPDPGEPQRLPGVLRAGTLLPYKPAITEINVDELPDGTPVRVRLTRYKPWRMKGPPVVLIHGYSASGTTFAHDAVRPNLARHLLRDHRDVWILDLRTSSGMPTARVPWTFEDAALVDIPAAIAHIVRTTNDETEGAGKEQKDQVDVVAHCMGSAMLSMAVLAQPKVGERFSRERAALPQWIRRAVLSQVGPIVDFSPANALRGYVLGYIRQFLPLQRYEFRTSPDPSLTDQLIDRLLATLPYPEEEFDIENPMWRRTPWVGTRHRMDALYARDFNLVNIPRRVLKYIDDLFGPLNIETVSQGIHFALHGVITDRAGHNVYVSREQLKERWKFPTLSVHGVDNGLADIKTLRSMASGFAEAGLENFHTRRFPGFGHQDSLIGRDAVTVFESMAQFLYPNRPPKTWPPAEEDRAKADDAPEVRRPFIGPHVGPIAQDRPDYLPIRAAKDPGRERAKCAVVLPVNKRGDRFVLGEVNGKPNWAAVPPPDLTALADGDGWVHIDVPLKTMEAVDGALVLLVDDPLPLPGSGLPDLDNVRMKLRGKKVPLSLAATRREELVSADADSSVVLTPSEADAIVGYFATLREMLIAALEKRPTADLLPAFVETPKHASDLCFAFGSCQYPAGILDAVVAERSMERLADMLGDEKRPAETNRPHFLVLFGDQVYVDATAGLFDPTSIDDRYGRTYERAYDRKAVQSVLRQLPSYNMLDDHEIADNWEPSTNERRPDVQLITARRSYWRYQRFDHFDNAAREFEHDLSFNFEQAGALFFVLDTRPRRSARTAATIGEAKIVDETTYEKLTNWLTQHANKQGPKFIACPSLPLPRHLRTMAVNADPDPNASPAVDPADDPGTAPVALRSDGWDGYPRSLYRLLGHIARHKIQNVVFLSGDEHLSLVAKATLQAPDETSVVVHSIHSSAMYAPFPFANGDRADFPEHDWFKFRAGNPEETYTCKVDVKFARRGDGFAVLSTADPKELLCQFVNAGDGKSEPHRIALVPVPEPVTAT
jgi:pimeloyl-ACP methyl ester carboxylesterase